jgi:hypothetical protein
MQTSIKYKFEAILWKYGDTKGAWYFYSLPTEISSEIRSTLKWQEEGWGRMKIVAQIGETKWNTAIWFDRKQNTYLLPIKAKIRSKNQLNITDSTEIIIWI